MPNSTPGGTASAKAFRTATVGFVRAAFDAADVGAVQPRLRLIH